MLQAFASQPDLVRTTPGTSPPGQSDKVRLITISSEAAHSVRPTLVTPSPMAGRGCLPIAPAQRSSTNRKRMQSLSDGMFTDRVAPERSGSALPMGRRGTARRSVRTAGSSVGWRSVRSSVSQARSGPGDGSRRCVNPERHGSSRPFPAIRCGLAARVDSRMSRPARTHAALRSFR